MSARVFLAAAAMAGSCAGGVAVEEGFQVSLDVFGSDVVSGQAMPDQLIPTHISESVSSGRVSVKNSSSDSSSIAKPV